MSDSSAGRRRRSSLASVLSGSTRDRESTNKTSDAKVVNLLGRSYNYYSGSLQGQHSLNVTPSVNVRSDTQKLAARASIAKSSGTTLNDTDTTDSGSFPKAGTSAHRLNGTVGVILEHSEPPSPEDRTYQGTSGLTKLIRESPLTSCPSSVHGIDQQEDGDYTLTQTPSQMSESTALLSTISRQAPVYSSYDLTDAIDVEGQTKSKRSGLAGLRVWSRELLQGKSKLSLTKEDAMTRSVEVVGFLPAVVLGLLLNILDALSYGMILFPLGIPLFSDLGSDGISMFYISCIVAQLVYSCGGSIFRGAIGSEMIEVVPFFHQMALSIMNDIGDDKPEAVIATTITAFAVSSVITGIVFYALGHFKLGSIIGYFPRHILVGCIGGVGYFLFVTGLEVSARLPGNLEYNMETLRHLVQRDTILLWTIPLVLAIALEVIQRVIIHPLVVPVYFCLVPIIFYIVVAAVPSLNLVVLRDLGWVFDAPASGKAWYDFYSLYKFNQIDFAALLRCFPAMLALTFFGILHVPINIPALGVSTGEDNVDVDRELKAHGISNALSGCLGSIQNYLVYTNSVLFIRSGGDSRIAGVMLAIGTAGIMFVGPSLIGKIPVMVVGALIFLLGMDLLKEALIDTIGKVHALEYLTILVIVLTMGIFDFVIGIIVGIILACVFFVVAMSKKSAIRAKYSGAVAKSTVRRPPVQQRYLREAGEQIQVYKLSGYMFFGSVTTVEKAVKTHVDERTFSKHPIRFLILDLTLAYGMDYSAAEAFTRMRRQLATKAIHFVLCGVKSDGEIGKGLQSVGLMDEHDPVQIYNDLNSALEACENALLEAFYQSEGLLIHDSKTGNLEVPKDAFKSLDMAYSPRQNYLQQAATSTLSSHLTDKPPSKYRNLAPPLPLLLQVFQDLSEKREDFWHKICQFFIREEIPAGKLLWKEGTEATCFYLVESGMIRASYHLETGILTENIAPGTVAGELPFLSDTPRTAELVTAVDTVVWKMDRKSFDKLRQMPGGLELVNELQKVGLGLTSERLSAILSYGLTK